MATPSILCYGPERGGDPRAVVQLSHLRIAAGVVPNEPHRQARELGTGGVRTSLRRQSLGRKGTQRRRRAWSRVRLNNSRWLQSSPSLESSSHRHRSDDFLVFFLIPKSTNNAQTFSLLPWDGGFYDRWCPREATHARHAPRPQANIQVSSSLPTRPQVDHPPGRE